MLTNCFVLIVLGAPIAARDIAVHRIPNLLVAVMLLSGLLMDLQYPYAVMFSRVLAGTFLSVIALILLVISAGGLGTGDVKLIMALGFCIGDFQQSLYAIFIALLFALIWMLVSGKKIIPFAPALLAGFISSIFWL